MAQSYFVKVSTFGELTFSRNKKVFKPSDVLSKNLLHVLEYLVCHHNQVVSKEQLIDTLWQDNLNPESALKFSIHRLRSVLNKEAFFNKPLVITTKNGYMINPECKLDVDLTTAELLVQRSKQKDITIIKKMEYLYDLIDIINKPFLHNSQDLIWSSSIREYYGTVYNSSVISLMQFAHEQDNPSEMLALATQAVQFDSLYEEHHYYYLISLIELKRYREAIEYYQWLIQYFHKELQVSLSPKVKDLYTFVIKQEEKDQTDFGSLIEELNDFHVDGSYFAEYEVFKRYYQIAKRLSDRNEAEYFVVMFEIKDPYSHAQINTITDDLIEAISSSLRKGDVFTRMNPKQFLLLIPCVSCHNIDGIIARIKNNYQNNAQMPFVTITHNVKQLA